MHCDETKKGISFVPLNVQMWSFDGASQFLRCHNTFKNTFIKMNGNLQHIFLKKLTKYVKKQLH